MIHSIGQDNVQERQELSEKLKAVENWLSEHQTAETSEYEQRLDVLKMALELFRMKLPDKKRNG